MNPYDAVRSRGFPAFAVSYCRWHLRTVFDSEREDYVKVWRLYLANLHPPIILNDGGRLWYDGQLIREEV